jgi:hypothetical protein
MARRATGRGAVWDPFCKTCGTANGGTVYKPFPAAVTLSNPQTIRGERFFTRVVIELTGNISALGRHDNRVAHTGGAG